MRLINTKTYELKEFMGSDIPRYAVLSHIWEEEEVTFQQFTQLPRNKVAKMKGYSKIQHTCRLARKSGIDWAWVDTCCIDKTSSAELSEAINSMFMWYAGSAVCYAYLESRNTRICRWFTRGWTLQELIAPQRMGFYNKNWVFQGEKATLSEELAEITKINRRVLGDGGLLPTISVAQRMSWAASRQTTRVEDLAYCLLGIFGVQIPLLYGEGSRAFIRLQEEIVKESNDLSLFAWRAPSPTSQKYCGILAESPRNFAECAEIEHWGDPMYNNECVITSKGLRFTPVPRRGLLELVETENHYYILSLQCHHRGSKRDLGIYLQQHGCDLYTRMRPDSLSETLITPKSKDRIFYFTKSVSPVMSVTLQSSHRHAIDMSPAWRALKNIHFMPDENRFELAGHWDTQRLLFLTQGMTYFTCHAALTYYDVVELPMTLVIKPSIWGPEPSVTVDIENARSGRTVPRHLLNWPIETWSSDGGSCSWQEVADVESEMINGQPVFRVIIGTRTAKSFLKLSSLQDLREQLELTD
ncbi:HET-domain-containing protein [Podospora appendiculata]|uniref:HET-domain-containing protein n=1 Tax=Podospora appendiculata TaxID=314037 RepID=A0AAE0WZB7_9PEZI|nr:HET-domain-containing protein [Podospora appendiculata]